MSRIRLIHTNIADARAQAAFLRSAGHQVGCGPLTPAVLQSLRKRPPAAVVIDLDRQPSLGRDVGLAIRQNKRTRAVSIVFAGGTREYREHVRKLLPDAAYGTWSGIRSTIKRAIANPPVDPVKPKSLFVGYSGTPLPKKLGIKAEFVVALIGAPPGFQRTMTDLPAGVAFLQKLRGRHDLIIWFLRSRKELNGRVHRMAGAIGRGGMWIAWPKKSSGVESDLSESLVRQAGLGAGLVDYKICAIDSTWSGLKFALRK